MIMANNDSGIVDDNYKDTSIMGDRSKC